MAGSAGSDGSGLGSAATFALAAASVAGPSVSFVGFGPVHGLRGWLCSLWAVSHDDYREPPRVRHRLSRRVRIGNRRQDDAAPRECAESADAQAY